MTTAPTKTTAGTPPIEGACDPAFAVVREFLADELGACGGVGGAAAVVVRGRTVADLWGGYRHEVRTIPWSRDTLVCLFSAGKPLAATAVLTLADDGLLDLDAPVTAFWPAFAQAGKDGITIRQALAHLAGVPAALTAPLGAVYDREALARALEAQPPLWPPGSQGCFHSFTYGILAGEIVRRVSGLSFPDYFRQRLAMPASLDLAFSLSAAEQARTADVILVPENPLLRRMQDPGTLLGQSWRPLAWDELNTPAFRGCDFPSLAGHGSALGLARFYGLLAQGGAPLLSTAMAKTAITEHWHHHDPFFGAPVRMGLGFMLANDLLPLTGPGAFAQPGLGGVVGLGDAHSGLGLGITVNRLAAGIENPRLHWLLQEIARRL